MMNTDNRLLTRESSEHIREFFGWAARYCTVLPISRSCLTAATGRREPGRRNFRKVPYGIVNEGAVGCHTGRSFIFFPPDERL